MAGFTSTSEGLVISIGGAIFVGNGLDTVDVPTDVGLSAGGSLEVGSCGVFGPESFVGIGGGALLGGLEGSGVVSRRIGSTLLADMARSKRGEEGSTFLGDRFGLGGVACWLCGLESCCPDCDRDEVCWECCCDDDRVLGLGAVGSGFSGDLGGVIEL